MHKGFLNTINDNLPKDGNSNVCRNVVKPLTTERGLFPKAEVVH
jgi:hypothetical protein